MTPGTRAVLRLTKHVPDFEWPKCVGCDEHVKFEAPPTLRARLRRGLPAHTHHVVCNVYTDGRWERTEHWHQDCFETAGCPVQPYHTGDTQWQKGTT